MLTGLSLRVAGLLALYTPMAAAWERWDQPGELVMTAAETSSASEAAHHMQLKYETCQSSVRFCLSPAHTLPCAGGHTQHGFEAAFGSSDHRSSSYASLGAGHARQGNDSHSDFRQQYPSAFAPPSQHHVRYK